MIDLLKFNRILERELDSYAHSDVSPAVQAVLEVGTLSEAVSRALGFAIHGQNPLSQDLFITQLAGLEETLALDLESIVERDPACRGFLEALLFYKGFHALAVYRISHRLWNMGDWLGARGLQALVSRSLAVDIHPAATLGQGIFIDHGTGVVIGETAVVGNNVSILHEVTLGGTGKEHGVRHPKIGNGVLIGAGAKVLGRITVGDGAKIAACSVVLSDVQPHTTVAGIPAKLVGVPSAAAPALGMDHRLSEVPLTFDI